MSKKIFYGWWISLASFFIGLYVAGVVHFGFTAFFEPLVKEFGWSYTQISVAASLRGLENGIFAPLIGFLVDRMGSRRLILCGAILIGLGFLLMSMIRTLVMFYGCFVLISLGAGGCMSVVLMGVVGKWFHKNVGKALALVACGFGAGGLIVPVVVWLIDLYQWRTTLIILGLGMWILGVPLSFVIRDKPEQYGYLPDGKSSQESETQIKSNGKEVEVSFMQAVKQRAFLYLILAEGIRMMAVYSVITHSMPYFSSVGIPRKIAGIVAAAIPLFSILGRIGFGWLGDLVDKRYMLAVALCLIDAGLAALCCVEYRGGIPIFILFFSSGFGGGMVVGRAIVREYFGRDSFGQLIGILMGSGAIGGIIGPTLAGWVFDTMGSYQLIWLLYMGSVGISIWLILRIKRPLNENDLTRSSFATIQ